MGPVGILNEKISYRVRICHDETYAMAVGDPEVHNVSMRRIRSCKPEYDAPETGGRVVEGW